MDLPLDSDLAGDRRTAELLTAIAFRAGAAILRFDCRNVSMRQKADESPVTLADEAAQAVILRGLTEGFPGVPIVSEEADRPESPGATFFLVDPLDGTKGFIRGRLEFTVNIGLIVEGRPWFGLVYAPALADFYVTLGPNEAVTAHLVADSARKAGADVTYVEAASRDADSIANALGTSGCDLLLTVGGSGVGRTDATVAALAQRGEVIAHGIALQPGRTTAVGRIDNTPVIALQGAPDQAFAAWWTLAVPVLDRLSGRRPRRTLNLPLARKVASGVGIAEIVLLRRKQGTWVTLAVGDLSLDAVARAEAWLVVSGGAEGFAAGAPVDGYMLRE